jgi:hypothetical protein
MFLQTYHLSGIANAKARRADISLAHGVSRGLAASKTIPEAQDTYLKEAALASGMETHVVVAVCITNLRCISNVRTQGQAII